MKMKIKVTICASMELDTSIIIYHYTNKALRGHVLSIRWPISRLKKSHRATVPTKKSVFLSPLFLRFFILRIYCCHFAFSGYPAISHSCCLVSCFFSLSLCLPCSHSPLCSWTFSDVVLPPFSIFSHKLHEDRFVFLLCLSKLKFFFVPEPSPTCFPRHFRFLSSNSMNTGSFSCFVFPPRLLLCFLFFYLYLHLYAFFISVFCFFTACLLFLLKLRFLSQKALIFVSTLHVHRFVFLLYLSKWIQVRFPSPSSSMFSFFTSICICMHFFISVFCFLTACSLFLLKLWFLSQKASIFISKLHVHKFVFLLRFLAWFSLIRFFYVFFFLPLFAFACVFSFRFFVFSLHVHCFF